MKKLLFIFVLIFAVSGCQQKGAKVVNISDSSYLNVNQVDKLPVISKKSPKKDLNVNNEFDSRLYIDENGKINKIVILTSAGEKNDKEIISMLEGLKIKPALKDGKNVKVAVEFALNKKRPEFGLMTEQDNSQYFVAVEQMPSPIGGLKAIQSRIVYPEIAKRAGIEGRVYILAYINEKGIVDKAKVLKGIGGGCDQSALKAVEETKFTPGRQRGKAVKTQVSVPIIFKLK